MENNIYETIFDEATRISWSPNEEGGQISLQRQHLLRRLAESSSDTLPMLLKILQEADPYRRTTAIEVIDAMDYSSKEPVIPVLICQIGAEDPNSPAWLATVVALSHLGSGMVVPHLIRAFLEKGEPYHRLYVNEYYTSWSEDIEGISIMLTRTTIESEYAYRCCTVVNYLLTQVDNDTTINYEVVDCLLDIVEKSEGNIDYIFPTLLALVKKYQNSLIEKRAWKLLLSASQEMLDYYRLLI